MKKQLLLGSLLFVSMSVFPQQGKSKPAGQQDLAAKINAGMAKINSLAGHELSVTSKANSTTPAGNSKKQMAVAQPTAAWNLIAGSRNSYGMIVSASKPLQYNAELNAVTFIHRCSTTYTASPADNTGAMVAEITTNWGATWDSTCFHSESVNQGRYPGGAIYNPAGNSNINNAYIVGSGPVFTTQWIGNFWASKQLGTANYNSTASSTPGAMQFLNNTSPLTHTAVGKSDFSRLCFTATNDGKMRSLGMMLKNANDVSSGAAYGFRGVNMTNGSYNAGVFDLSGDSIMFAGVVNQNTSGTPSTTDDYFMTTGSPVMAWNQSGSHGYVVVIGARSAASNSASSGYQPIVWKTDNFGASWSLVPGIDFSSSTYSNVLTHIDPVETNTNLTIPFFNTSEGIGAVVDANNKLHIFSTIVATGKSHADSLGYTYSYTMSINSPTATYSWPHTPGYRAYIYDFMLDGGTSTWDYMLVDSLGTEAPGDESGEGGYPENPYDGDAGVKLIPDARIQASRTPTGDLVFVSYAESDTNYVNGQVKYNVIPEIKLRTIDIQNAGGYGNYKVWPNEVVVSKLGPAINNQVDKKAMMHYMSPVTSSLSLATGKLGVHIPFTVSHSEGPGTVPGSIYAQLGSTAHWYTSAFVDFSGVGINENALGSVSGAVIYPNPASRHATVLIDMKNEAAVDIEVYSTIGQLMKSSKTNTQIGENNIRIDLSNLSTGIYLVSIKAGNAVSTKKLIVE
ncbi:MAG: BNR/Asp-box repeat protein [Bacteroidetes bacterium]|jgi:hypothetical protein|nr:BNR/Asp-box repeat protein [Bacteroidota bacterium]